MELIATTEIPRDGYYGSYARLRQEFASLASAAVSWDQTFEHATGTYPTPEFAAGYRAFTDRALRAMKLGDSLPNAGSSEFDQLCSSALWHDYVRATSMVLPRLDRMAATRTPFRAGENWSILLDPMINDLRRGERLITAKLLTLEPSAPATPNPGVPSGTPSYPGGPRPTPIP